MDRKLDGFDKVAILLVKLGEDAASEVMKGLDSKHLRQIGARISNHSNIPKDDIEAVLKEFSEKARNSLNIEGKDYIQKVFVKTLGQEKATQMMQSLSSEEEEGLERLSRMDPKSITNIIRGEHPQTVALILTHLDTNQSSEVLSHLPEDLRAGIILRMATLEDIPHGVMKEIGAAIQSELDVIGTASSRKVKGVKLVADILNQTDPSSEEAILASISQGQPELAEQIRQLMFVFDDLVHLNDRGMQELLKEVSKEELALALRAAKETIKEKIFKNMSERAAQLLNEDMEAKGPVKLSEVEKAQLAILNTAKKLEEEGKIVIGGKGAGDAMV